MYVLLSESNGEQLRIYTIIVIISIKDVGMKIGI